MQNHEIEMKSSKHNTIPYLPNTEISFITSVESYYWQTPYLSLQERRNLTGFIFRNVKKALDLVEYFHHYSTLDNLIRIIILIHGTHG